MATNQDTGKEGEDLAVQWLSDRDYTIIQRNWRYAQYEIDIIASKGNKLHFVEVKTRKTKKYGPPDEEITRSKIRQMIAAGEEYMHQHPGWKWVRFDVLAITILQEEVEYFFIEDVYL